MLSTGVGAVIEKQNVLVLDTSKNVVHADLREKAMVRRRDVSAMALR